MAQIAFNTNSNGLKELMRQCGSGRIQLPEFKRSWIWDEGRTPVRSLKACTISDDSKT